MPDDSNRSISFELIENVALYGGRDGGVHDTDMVTSHSITLTGLDPNFSDSYEFRIRSTNDANDPPAVPGEIIWGYVGKLDEY